MRFSREPDENDNVIRPAILWNDGRTAEETEWLRPRCFRRRPEWYDLRSVVAGGVTEALLIGAVECGIIGKPACFRAFLRGLAALQHGAGG